MKRFLGILIIPMLIASCGGESKKSVDSVIESGDLTTIRAKKESLTEEFDVIAAELAKLDEAISKLDTVKKLALVSSLKISDTLFQHYVQLQGNVSTKQNIVMNSEYSGILKEVLVKEGQQVKKGQLLARIDDGGLSAQLAQLQVQTELAKTTFERQKRLWEQNIGSEMQYLQAKTQFEANQNAVAQLESQLGKTRVTAPFTGSIDEIIADPGSNLAPGSPVLRIVSLGDMYIEIEVPEIYIPSISKGTEVKAYFPVLGKEYTTKVRQVSNFINPANRTFRVEFAVPNDNGLIKPNLTARVKINDYTSEKAMLIPQSIITENADGDQYVYTTVKAEGGIETEVQQTIITTGKTQGDLVEVLEGIEPGDEIISEGARSLLPGQKVQIKNN
ncbi:efflux RND transporter periplasmic adaptor subunit [Robertkochia solimangrovi]|uniref:efflux RND transporter periplasmic adaptor subunit n=1 Tax=Robertkochia solimangrovi TaxID=2213046 RepID=UPI00117E3823|nr:efflux RND transporter periplasmic adaptor subunit [Robertkochia solimangrovi]TRZ46265.1 efflux RND transporter periplasmic adaptor subunit [Robertkochia solimangrovi]